MPTAARIRRVRDVLAKRQPDLRIVADDVYKPHNLSAMLRSCDAVGIGQIHAVHAGGEVPTYNATSASAEKWVDVRTHGSVADAVDALRSELPEVQVLATNFSAAARDYRDVDYTRPTAIVFGNERSGVSAEAIAQADLEIVVPMHGMVPSLNVSVATAVILFEAQRQRRAAGFYDRPRLSQATHDRLAFRWLFPDEAARRDRDGEPFPAIDLEQLILEAERDDPTPLARTLADRRSR